MSIKEIKEFLDEHDIEYVLKDNSFKVVKPEGSQGYEIRYIVARDYPVNTPKYNIEGVSKNYFHDLSKAAEEDNNFINFIYDYEWLNEQKREVLKSYILHSSGKTPTKIYARDCEVVEVAKEGIEFEKENCLFGTRGASLRLGLKLKKDKNGLEKGTLLQIYSFGLNFFSKKRQIEVIRVGTKRQCQVVGGVSKLLKHFILNYPVLKVGKNEIEVDNIYYYLDYIHQAGKGVEKMGFEFVKSTPSFRNLWLGTGPNGEDECKQRQPAKHKWVMEQTEAGKVVPIANSGTKTFVLNVEKWKKERNIERNSN